MSDFTVALQECENFEILIGKPLPTGQQIVVIKSPVGDTQDNSCLDVDQVRLQSALAELSSGQMDEIALKKFGGELFAGLFPGPVADNFHQALETVRQHGQVLRICLRFQSPELATLPWEYLYDPEESTFLALAPDLTLFRYIPLGVAARPAGVKLPFRALLLLANPSDYPTLESQREKQVIEFALESLKDQVALKVVEHATLAAIRQAMREFHPHVVHFAGHGFYEDDKGIVVLENEQGHADLVDAQSFGALFKGDSNTRLVVLNACQLGTGSDTISGLSRNLLASGISSVIAMQQSIPDRAAIVFSRELYRSIAVNYPIDRSVTEARRGIRVECRGEGHHWATPMLFLRAPDGILFRDGLVNDNQHSPVPPPPPPIEPDDQSFFVGREAELERYSECLTDKHQVVIYGAPGCGKTRLAVRLARRVSIPEKIFWHQFLPGEGLETMMEQLAAFFAWNGQDTLWNLIQNARLNHLKPYPPAILLNYLTPLLGKQQYLFCLDDIHCVDNEQEYGVFFGWLLQQTNQGRIWVIATSRSLPQSLSVSTATPLSGLNLDDARQYVQNHLGELPDETLNVLHGQTNGNVTILNLAVNLLRQEKYPAMWVSHLAEVRDIQSYLQREVYKRLTYTQRVVMEALSILMGYPGSRPLIEALLHEKLDLFSTLTELCDRDLVERRRSGAEWVYTQHAILQEFYYQSLDDSERMSTHMRAGEYYQNMGDFLLAALHYEKADAIEKAIRIVCDQVRAIINHGQGRPLLELMRTLLANPLTPEQRVELRVRQADVQLSLSAFDECIPSYRELFMQLERIAGDSANLMLLVDVCRGLGEALQYTDPREALSWFDRGLQEIGDSDPYQATYLYILRGNALIAMGEYEDARQSVEQGMALLTDDVAFLALKMDGLINLGNIYSSLGDIGQGMACNRQALALSRELQDNFRRITILTSLGLDEFQTGDWQNGILHTQEAAEFSGWIESLQSQARLLLNLGWMYMCKGEDQKALENLTRGLEISQEAGIDELTIAGSSTLADYYLRHEQTEIADSLLSKAEAMALRAEMKHLLPEIYRHKAFTRLLQHRIIDAQEAVKQCLELAEAMKIDSELGLGKRLLGQTFTAQEDFVQACMQFDESIKLLENDPFEVARTKLVKGKMLVDQNDPQGSALLAEAAQAMEQLGVRVT